MFEPKPVQEQGTDDWRQARAGCVTGTGFLSVLARAKRTGEETKERSDYRMRLIAERITGIPSVDVSNRAMSWGIEHEEEARAAFELYMAARGENIFVQRAGFVLHPELPWVGVSPDGLIGDQGMVEIKCPYSSTAHLTTIIRGSPELSKAARQAPAMMPEEYYPQVQGGLWVLGRQWCDYVSYDPRQPEHLRLYVARIERDEEYIKKLEAEVRQFLGEVEDGVAALLLHQQH